MENKNAPTFKPNKGARFYNAGDRISEAINFSLPGQVNLHSGNLMANWAMDAPAGSFFSVPTEIRLLQDDSRIAVDFPATVLQRFGDRGVVMIDDEWDPGQDEDRAERMPFARNDAEAKEKGDKRWLKYLQDIVKNHMNACDRAKAAGGFPLEAQGFTKRAFKLLNMRDPAAMAFDSFQKQHSDAPGGQVIESPEVEKLRSELAATNAKVDRLVAALEAKSKIDESDAIEEQATRTRGKSAKDKATA